MLTYTPDIKVKRKDRPWLLLILVLIWVSGTAFFHSAWEPYEPFVFAVVKGIISNHSWLVPYISSVPYFEIQPFYFWVYSAIIKLLAIENIDYLANAIRLINMLIIFAVIALAAKIGSQLSAYKNGRTVVLILISTIGFINNAYQLSPNMLILLGFCLYIYALQLHYRLPGISGGILFSGLFIISISFTCEFVIIGLITLLILPCIDRHWRSLRYAVTATIGVVLFISTFYLYSLQLQSVNDDFFLQWQHRYTSLFVLHRDYGFFSRLSEALKLLVWYTVPAGFLVAWSFYKRKLAIFNDKIAQVSIILSLLLIGFALFTSQDIGGTLFPIIITLAFIASLEVDSIRITIVSLFNWLCIFTFGLTGLILWMIYGVFNLNSPLSMVTYFTKVTQEFIFSFSWWRVFLAILITFIWFFMITRRHIRGREMITNWASGTTCVIILFLSLWLPWFDSVLTFRPIVEHSLKYINKSQCVGTNGEMGSQVALWYYYAEVNLMPSFVNINFNLCNQAIIATEDPNTIDATQWKILWSEKRPIDKKTYYVVQHN